MSQDSPAQASPSLPAVSSSPSQPTSAPHAAPPAFAQTVKAAQLQQLLRTRFAALRTEAESGTEPAHATYATPATLLEQALRGGNYRLLQAELPSCFLSSGRPHHTLATLLTHLPPRLPQQARAAGANGKGNGSSMTGAPAAAATISAAPGVADPAASPSSWFFALLAAAPLARIGTAHHHSLQLLLINSVASLLPSATPSAADQDLVRSVLLPRWMPVPSVVQALCTAFALDLPWPEQHAYFLALQQAGHFTDAASWLVHFGAAAKVPAVELLSPLLRRGAPMGSEGAAIELAQSCPPLRDPLIRLLTTQAHKSSTSLKCMHRWGMDPADFPEVTYDLSAKQLKWLVREGKAEELGSEVCGQDEQLQRALVRELLQVGEVDQAAIIMSQFGLEADEALRAEVDAQRARLAHTPELLAELRRGLPVPKPGSEGPFLQLPPSIPIIFVTPLDSASLDAAAVGLSSSPPSCCDLVGLDVEFGFTGSSSSAPALLQISSRRQVFLFDLLEFPQCPRMGSILQQLFRDPLVRKVGYAWDGDWSVLRSGFPGAQAFAMQTNVLDMADPARWVDRQEKMKEDRVAREEAARQARMMEEAAKIGASIATEVDTGPEDMAMEMDAAADLEDDEDEQEDADMSDAVGPLAAAATAAVAVASSLPPTSSSADAVATAATASPDTPSSRFSRRRAKKAAKKAAKSPFKDASASASPDEDPAAPPPRKGVARGLSSLAHLCLGLPLDKFYQISAWRRRPLKPAQMHYAALDAWCLLGVYDRFFGAARQRLELLGQLDAALPDVETFVQYEPLLGGAPAAAAAMAASTCLRPMSAPAPVSPQHDGVLPCSVSDCNRASCHALSLRQCVLHTCQQCRRARRSQGPLCNACDRQGPASASASAAAEPTSGSAFVAAPAMAPSAGRAAVPWSDRCRHVVDETMWTPEKPAGAGRVCGNRALLGSTYCQQHLCHRCLGACADATSAAAHSVMYPCCTRSECHWPNLAALHTSVSPTASASTRADLMLSVARVIVHALPVPCVIYGGFVRDWLLRGEPANDLDVVVCPPKPTHAPGAEGAADARRSAYLLPCVDALLAHVSRLPVPLILESRAEKAPSASSFDYLLTVTLRPSDPLAFALLGRVQCEFALAGSYAAGEVDADVNNLAVGGGTSLLPRDVHVPFSPPHTLRHVQAKQFAYVRQAGWKLGIMRLWKLHWRGWKRVATIPWKHPNAGRAGAESEETGENGSESAAAADSASSREAGSPRSGDEEGNTASPRSKLPPWAVCPTARLEMGV